MRKKLRHKDISGKETDYVGVVRIRGKAYKLHRHYYLKRNALREERRLQKLGFLTHAFDTKASGFLTPGYVLYTREKAEGKRKTVLVTERRSPIGRRVTPRITPKTPRLRQ